MDINKARLYVKKLNEYSENYRYTFDPKKVSKKGMVINYQKYYPYGLIKTKYVTEKEINYALNLIKRR